MMRPTPEEVLFAYNGEMIIKMWQLSEFNMELMLTLDGNIWKKRWDGWTIYDPDLLELALEGKQELVGALSQIIQMRERARDRLVMVRNGMIDGQIVEWRLSDG
jgi:hypothetical protein